MKKVIVFFVILISFPEIICAQKIYIRAGFGYGLPAASSVIAENSSYSYIANDNIDEETSSFEAVSGSYGSGTNISVAIGYEFNENFILDLNIQYLKGRKYKSDYINYEDYFDNITIDEEYYTSYARGIFFNPGFIFSAGWGKLAPYARIGIIAGLPKVTENDDYYYYADDGAINEDNITWIYGGGLALGYQTGIGINWKINEKLDVFSELNFVSMSYYAKVGEMTNYIQDGIETIDQQTVYSTNTDYRKEFDQTMPYDADKPRNMIRESRPFSFISGQVGIRFTLLKQNYVPSDY